VRKRLSTVRTEKPLDERLLTAAVEVFLEKGFAAASVDEIAARAKASKLTFYNHYGNKEALFEAVVSRQNAELTETMGETIPEGMPLEQSLKAIANRLHTAFYMRRRTDFLNLRTSSTMRAPPGPRSCSRLSWRSIWLVELSAKPTQFWLPNISCISLWEKLRGVSCWACVRLSAKSRQASA
jgi:AcrR family transcriptional regulator